MPQHHFVYVRDVGVGEAEKKIFHWQKEGIGIGSSASGPNADITALVGEQIILKKLEREGYKLKMYKRYRVASREVETTGFDPASVFLSTH